MTSQRQQRKKVSQIHIRIAYLLKKYEFIFQKKNRNNLEVLEMTKQTFIDDYHIELATL